MKAHAMIFCVVVLTALGCSCSPQQPNSKRPLPDAPAWAVAEPERAAAIIRGAEEYCKEMAGPIARMCCGSAVPVGQLMLVEQRLANPTHYVDREPLCIFATTGTAGTGDEYLMVTAFSLSREIEQVDILARGPSFQPRLLSVIVPRQTKSLEAIWSQYFVVEREGWESFQGRFETGSSSPERIVWTKGTVIPLPSGDDVELCVKVVDRMTGSSTWVPICRFDYPR